MHRILIAICEEEAGYCERLSEYLLERKKDSLEIHVFSDPEVFQKELAEKEFHAALMGESFWKEGIPECGITRFIYLSEGSVPEQWREYPAIYKYQSADNILREVYGLIGEEAGADAMPNGNKELIGVFSPHQHEMQTMFSLTFARLLAEGEKVLYLNLMDCAGFQEIFDEEYEQDVGDLIYLAKNQGNVFSSRLKSMIHSNGGVDYIPPASNPENLHEAGKEDYERLLTMLCEKTAYDVILIDFGAMIPGFYELLNRCDAVYCPVKEGFLYDCRIRQFQNCMALSSKYDFVQNIRYLTFSMDLSGIQDEEQFRQQLLWGELGDYIRSQILGTMRNAISS